MINKLKHLATCFVGLGLTIILAFSVHTIVIATATPIALNQVVDQLQDSVSLGVVEDTVPRYFRSTNNTNGGIEALAYLLTRFGDSSTGKAVLQKYSISRKGIGNSGLIIIASKAGYSLAESAITYEGLPSDADFPAIVKAGQSFYLIVHNASDNEVVLFDPRVGAITAVPRSVFIKNWDNKILSLTTK
jgi:hypothetical protein